MNSKIPEPSPVFELMSEHLARVTVELFAAYDIAVRTATQRAVPIASSDPSGIATIGYVGEKVRGALILMASDAAVAAWMAAIGITEGEVADTLGEFSNMLLGRLKGRLWLEGLPILLATPMTTSGSNLRVSVPPVQSTWLTWDGPGWQLTTRLDAEFERGFALDAGSHERPAEAGEAIIF